MLGPTERGLPMVYSKLRIGTVVEMMSYLQAASLIWWVTSTQSTELATAGQTDQVSW